MKKIIIIVVSIIVVMALSLPLLRKYTKSKSPQETVSFSYAEVDFSISYSRPFKKNRVLFGNENQKPLHIYGMPWRTGANEASEVTFTKNLIVGGQTVSAGTYSIYTIPGEENWILAINKKTNYWGLNPFGETFESNLDVARITAPVIRQDNIQEQLSIGFNSVDSTTVNLFVRWDDFLVNFPLLIKQ